MRPVLTPSARRLWRDPTTLQLGHDTARATVLVGVDAGTRAALVLLDGTRDRAQLLSAGAAVGCPPERMVSLLALLGEAGLLEDAGEDRSVLQELAPVERDRLAADLGSLALVRGDGGLPAARHRRSTRVLVVGAGRVGAPLAAMLGTAGIGAVDVVDDSTTRPEDTGVGGLDLADVGRSRGEAARSDCAGRRPRSARSALSRRTWSCSRPGALSSWRMRGGWSVTASRTCSPRSAAPSAS